MKKLLLILMVLMASARLFSQTTQLDSIKAVIAKHPQRDSLRVSMLVDYVLTAVNTNTSQALPFMQEIVSISKELNFAKGIQLGYIYLQIYYSDRGDFAESALYGDTAIRVLQKDTSLSATINIAYLYNNLGGDSYKMGDYSKAIDHYTKAAEIMEKYKPEIIASAYNGLSVVYEALSQPEKAFEYDKKAIAAAEKSGNKASIARRYLNYAERLFNLKYYREADSMLKKSAPLVSETNDVIAMALFYQLRGGNSRIKKQYPQAIADFRAAYQIGIGNDDKYQQISLLDPLIKSLLDAGELDQAKTMNDTLLAKSILYQMPFGRLNAYDNLAKWNLLRKDYANAYRYLELKTQLADSISSDETKSKISMMETRFKVAGKDREIKSLQDEKQIQQLQLRQKSTFIYILIGSAIALLIISLLSYRNYRHRQKLQQAIIDELETEKQLTATEAVFKGEEQERTRLAKDLHDGLGGMLSGIKFSLSNMKENLVMTPDNARAFGRSIDMLDSSIKEMRRVAHNMMPEILVKYGLDTALKEFCSEIDRSGAIHADYQSVGMGNVTIDQTTSVAIYRVVQELVNNAIKHAQAKCVLVQLHHSVQEKMLAVTVEDNGKGLDVNMLKDAAGLGWRSIQNRVDFLKGKIDVHSKPDEGTSVMIEIGI
ncbi:tetratricopeptide repeat protein [Pseudoflavitalea sp. G-6-1-2]|uniref:tetratricopeptide repeat-containing sensor histidine kinase n=1 Tax=Pseudoflavitalea sp. G-6-1-2 TaxID=2728841 RepID=UPI00146B653D|nr:tetratricopeptide repeat protein [Pseudoflavitalea sp. G-6-1-2]NML23960.1 tetratricopeptide repeat protein [Pseudoflavitalea sp. G-6-1-2]